MFILYCKIQDQFLNLIKDLSYVVICRTLVLHFSLLKDVIISSVYFSNDILFVFMIAVATMDHNEEILRVIGHLREIGSAWRGGDELRCSLSASFLTIVDTITISNDALYSIASYRKPKYKNMPMVSAITRSRS